MRLRTFTAPDMPAAMQMVRDAMGEDAIIISSESGKGKSITVTAALDGDDDTPKNGKHFEPISKRDSVPDDLRFAMQDILRFHNVPELFIAKILQKASEGNFASALALHRAGDSRLHQLAMEKLMGAYFHFDPLLLPPDSGALRLMLIGLPGIGKTLTVAKLATKLTMAKEPVAVMTTDTKRAGGVEQLQAFTQILGIELMVASSRTDLWKKIKAQGAKTHILIDTAGCNPYDEAEWQETQSYATLEGIEPLLVMQAGGDSLEAIDMTEIFAALPIKRLLVTRADSTRRFGAALSAAAAHQLAFCQASVSAGMANSLKDMNAGLLAQWLLRYQSQTG